jgi:membrane protease YdiL (CAAX protease family)
MSGLKDAATLLAYLVVTVLFGALAAPWLFRAAQSLAAAGILPWLARFDFETFFHRALLIGALVFLWPLLRSLRIRGGRDLGIEPNRRWKSDAATGFLLASIPVICVGAVLVALSVYIVRHPISWSAAGRVALASIAVPFIEETLFRGLLFGIFERARGVVFAVLSSSAIFAIVHFLKAPVGTTTSPTWFSGFVSIANSFAQFREPMLVLAGFTTLFLIGCILAHARALTRSLWLPIGLHAGWIFASGEFGKLTRRQMLALPWVGKTLLIGVVPLAVGLLTWAAMLGWFRYVRARDP